MYRDSLISKEKMESMYRGEIFRQSHHKTPRGNVTYQESVTHNLETLFKDLQLGRNPISYTWTYFLPALTEEELKLVEYKNQQYFNTFKSSNPDVAFAEMNRSQSNSKYVSAYCQRVTDIIENPMYNLRQSNKTLNNQEPDKKQFRFSS